MTAIFAFFSMMSRQNNVHQVLKWPETKHLLLTHSCAPAKSARNSSCLVLIQTQAACLHCNHCDLAFSTALGSSIIITFSPLRYLHESNHTHSSTGFSIEMLRSCQYILAENFSLDCWSWRPYMVRGLFLSPLMSKVTGMVHPVLPVGFL